MDRFGPGPVCDLNEALADEVALGGGGRADAVGLVRRQHVGGEPIGLGVHGDGADTELARAADDAQGDFAPVRDEERADQGPDPVDE